MLDFPPKLRFLFICNEYPPIQHGGIGTFTRDLAEGLVNKGHEVTVWGLYAGLKFEVIEKSKGVIVHRLPYLSTVSRIELLWFVLSLNIKLRLFLSSFKFDIIECQEWQGLLPFGLNGKYVIRLHGATVFFDKLLGKEGNRFTHFLEKLTIRKAKNIVAVSDFCGKETLRLLALSKPYKVIYNSIDTKRISSFRSDQKNEYSIVFVNSVLPKKGIFELAAAFNIISDSYPDSTLVFIGKLGYQEFGKNVKELILNQIQPKNRERVIIKGWLENPDDVYKLIANAHVCCYPSHMEGFGIAPVEAMALGKTVIYMKDGPGPEVIEDGVSGFLVDTKSQQAIAEKIIEIFSGKFDLIEIGINARGRALKLFDRDSVSIRNNLDYYTEILA